MPARNYTVEELCARCSQTARYTDEHGNRLCAHHSTGVLAIRDVDIPRLLTAVESLLNIEHVDRRARSGDLPVAQDIRGMIGRRA